MYNYNDVSFLASNLQKFQRAIAEHSHVPRSSTYFFKIIFHVNRSCTMILDRLTDGNNNNGNGNDNDDNNNNNKKNTWKISIGYYDTDVLHV